MLGFEQSISDSGSDDRAYIGLNLETGAGLSNRALVMAAEARRDAVARQLDDQERLLRRKISSLLAELKALEGQQAPMRSIIEGSEAMVASYLNQFRVGKKTWLDVLNGHNEKTQAYFLKTDVEMPLLKARASLQLLTVGIESILEAGL